jgi:hypothetical protein
MAKKANLWNVLLLPITIPLFVVAWLALVVVGVVGAVADWVSISCTWIRRKILHAMDYPCSR